MTHVIEIHNPGNLDLIAAKTLGVNVKPESDNPFGRFGSGFCFSLATMLRHEIDIQLWIDGKNIPIATETRNVRGENFEIILIDGVECGFTTALGKDWELWMAYREFYSNARDENGDHRKTSNFVATPGTTQIVFSDDAILELFDNQEDYFIGGAHGKPLFENENIQIFRNPNNFAPYFYQGIRVTREMLPSEFIYNMLTPMRISEDRTIDKMDYQGRLGREFHNGVSNEELIRKAMLANEAFSECSFDVDWWTEPSDEFVIATSDLLIKTNNHSLVRWLNKQRSQSEILDLRDPIGIETTRIERGIEFLAKVDYPITYPIKIVAGNPGDALALALSKENIIALTPKLLSMGQHWVVRALVEEQMHLEHGLHDHTREMQNHIFGLLIAEFELRSGDVL